MDNESKKDINESLRKRALHVLQQKQSSKDLDTVDIELQHAMHELEVHVVELGFHKEEDSKMKKDLEDVKRK